MVEKCSYCCFLGCGARPTESRRGPPLSERPFDASETIVGETQGGAANLAGDGEMQPFHRQRFARLNPYDPGKIGGSVLRMEDVNLGEDGQRQLWCHAIPAKRYCLYVLDEQGEPELVKWSEHGLGHLLNPTDATSDEREWLRQLWEGIVRKVLGLPPWWPAWLDRPALSRLTISSPELLKPFAGPNAGKPYPDQVKPFNFMLTAHVARFGHPDGVDPTRFQLFAPYESDPQKWLRLPWTDRYSGRAFRISATADTGGTRVARVQTYRDVLEGFLHYPKPKSAGSDGRPCDRQTVGLLGRRPVLDMETIVIGTEANELEQVAMGLIDELVEVQVISRQDWFKEIRQMPRGMTVGKAMTLTGLSRRQVYYLRAGKRTPTSGLRSAALIRS